MAGMAGKQLQFPYRKKEVVVDGVGRFVIREPTWGEYNEIIGKTATILPNGSARIDWVRFRLLMLMKCIEEAPIPVNEETLNSLPASVGEQLYRVVEEFLSPLMKPVSLK